MSPGIGEAARPRLVHARQCECRRRLDIEALECEPARGLGDQVLLDGHEGAVVLHGRECALVTVNEHLIAEATRRLALEGFYVETSSALALAGVDEARARGLADPGDTAVAIVTANGRGWSEEAEGLFSPLPSARAASRRGSGFRQA